MSYPPIEWLAKVRHSEPPPSRRTRFLSLRRFVRSAGVLAIAVPVFLAASTSAVAYPPAADQLASDDPSHEATVAALEAMVDNGTPGVVARVERGRRHWSATAGVAELDRNRPRTPEDHFRIASITKTFIAVTLLELEADGELSVDDSVEEWLPGVLDRNGYDGSAITIRQLLNHTSGVFNVLADPTFVSRYRGETFLDHRFDDWTPAQLVHIATSHPPLFAPGEGWSYSNTNYILAGMVIEAVTGRSYADVVEDRLLQPLGLAGTSLPGHSPDVPEPHARAYSRLFVSSPDAPIYDVTEFNPSLGGAAAEMVSTTRDLNRFFTELLSGRILPPAQQRELLAGVETGHGFRYGLGVQTYALPCGTVWGNDGDIFGSVTYTASTADGSHALTFNANENWTDDKHARGVIDTEFCG